ncbi:Autoinducer 2 sensor kinase/phosphatase LuxQ [anaerobic digester metagenome]
MQTIHPEDRQKCTDEWVETVKNGSSIISEYRFIRPNGNVIWVQGQAVPEIVNNEVKGFIGTITDITEIIDSKNELLKAKEKAEASNLLKTMFMQNISHEIRTPLNGIFGFAQLLSTGEYTEEEKLEFMRFLEESISRLTKTIDNIMEISLLMSGNMQKNNAIFNLHEWINEIYQEHHQKVANKNLLFTLKDSVDKNESLIMADKALLKRVIEEIIDNAVKFTLQGSITLSCALPEDELIIEISDTGQGIDKVFMPMLFEPFIQQSSVLPGIKSSGGIGLSIVKGIVDLLGGKIHVSSDAQNGTSIVVKVPIERLVQRAKKTKESSNSPTKENPRILVVEDEEINLLFIKKLLSKYPCQLMISGNGLHAIELLKKHPDLDLVLMDIKLPGISGIETIRKMIEIKPDLKIAAVTAYSSLEDRNACVAAGCVDFITKPFYSEELFDLTGRLINWPFGYTADEPPA